MPQPDLGSAWSTSSIVLAVLFVAGTTLAALRGARSRSAPSRSRSCSSPRRAVGVDGPHAYQKDRLTSFLHPTDNPGEAGLPAEPVADRDRRRPEDRPRRRGHADQAQLPARAPHRLHLRGGRRALGLRRRGPRALALRAADLARVCASSPWRRTCIGALVAGGIVAMLMFQVFVNVGMNVGIMPITGIPLPLMSYGGSSVITTLIGLRPAAVDLRARARRGVPQGPRAGLSQGNNHVKSKCSSASTAGRPAWR